MKPMEDIKKIKKELKICQKQSQEYLLGWKRERADFINFKGGESERIKKAVGFAQEKIILEILCILDNIYLAEKNIPQNLKKDPWTLGMIKIKDQILEFFKKMRVEEIKCLNREFDPRFQEAVEYEDSKEKSQTVIEVIKKGYTLDGKVIRPAKVKISK